MYLDRLGGVRINDCSIKTSRIQHYMKANANQNSNVAALFVNSSNEMELTEEIFRKI